MKLPRFIHSTATLSAVWLTLAGSHSTSAQVPNPPPHVTVLADLEYHQVADAPKRTLKLDLYRPQHGPSPHPVIVFVHGGGWKNGSRRSAQQALWLVEHGYAIAGIEYRLTDEAQWPAQINDCYAAVRWLRNNAAKYNLDPNHIGAWGTSAGGHLVALMGTREYPGNEQTSSRVQAVCDWFGPSDLLTMPPNNVGNGRTAEDVAKSNGAKLLGATVREVPTLARDASAMDHVSSDDPPFLIMHGDQDPGVPLTQSTRLHAKLASAKVSSRLHVVQGAGHGGKQFRSDAVRRAVLQFFNRTLKPDWRQGGGPLGRFQWDVDQTPTHWSGVHQVNIRWKLELPETGQSTVVICNGNAYFTTMEPQPADAALGSNIIAWCVDADSGEVQWKHRIPAKHPLRLSGCFSDSSSPPPVTDGKHVVFFNASGAIEALTTDGTPVWRRETMPVGRTQPFMLDGSVVFIKQSYMPDEHGHFTHDHQDAPLDQWTQLQALDIATGEPQWQTTCGVNMGCVPLPLSIMTDGEQQTVIAVGRGGGHSPPEKPEGVSLVDRQGNTLWTTPLDGFMSTMSFHRHGEHLLVFHGDEHLWLDMRTGKIVRRVHFADRATVRTRVQDDRWESQTLTASVKSRGIIQQSNVLAGDYHYFRHYTQPWLGRVHAVTGKVEYLQLPVQMKSAPNRLAPQFIWTESDVPRPVLNWKNGKPMQRIPIQQWAFQPNAVRNSRGLEVMGDVRSRGNGWGHHASAVPTVIGDYLYVPIMSGNVYVIRWNAPALDEHALVSINDLGPIGETWTRSSLSYSGGRIYAHTIKSLICIETTSDSDNGTRAPEPRDGAR